MRCKSFERTGTSCAWTASTSICRGQSFLFSDDVAVDIESTKTAWGRFGEFINERNGLSNRDWISIRGRLYELDDFMAKWGERVRESESKDAIAVLLCSSKSTSINGRSPGLKFCRGEGWESSHWAQLFSILRFPTKGPEAVTRENLTLQHFLDKADLLIEKADELKTLHSQAQGEVTLREALHQLKVWGLDRNFSLISHTMQGPKGGIVSLIKEWKDLFTEVADNQNLVSSLKDSPFFGRSVEETSVWETMMADVVRPTDAHERYPAKVALFKAYIRARCAPRTNNSGSGAWTKTSRPLCKRLASTRS